MPKHRITDRQVRRYMDVRRNGATQIVAAAKAGISERSARRYQIDPTLPSQRSPRSGRRTRIDPLVDVWDAEIVPLLVQHPHLRATTILEQLHRDRPGQFGENVLRTLQRRVAQWRAISGPERELIFRQDHPPGWQAMFWGRPSSSCDIYKNSPAILIASSLRSSTGSAPETRYTGSTEDNYAALHWMHASANELGIDRRRIALLGESAGGTHAALLAIAARDRGEVPVAFQALIYPMLDDRTGATRQPPPFIGRIVWDAASNRYGWRSFLGVEPGGEAVPSAAVPARVTNLEGLPPTFISVGGADLFLDEDVEYARRLSQAGVATELLVVPRAFHAFDRIAPDTDIARRFNAAKIDALRRAFRQEA